MKKGPESNKNKAAGKTSLFGLLKPYSGLVTALVLFALAGNGINLIIPLIISHAIDAYSSGLVLGQTIISFLTASFFILIFNYLQGIAQTYTSEKAARDLRKQLSDKISRQSFAYVLHTNPARLLTNLTSDIDSIKMFISQAVVSIISSAFVIAGASVMLLSLNWKLALSVLFIIPIIGGAFFLMFRKVKVLFKKGREAIDWLNKVITESILGATLIRVLNSQVQEYQKFMKANASSRDIGLAILSLFAALIPVITFVSNLAMLLVLLLGGHFVIGGSMTLGNLAAFNSYISLLVFPIIMIGFMSNSIASATASYQRIQEVLGAPEAAETGTLDGKLSGHIIIRNVNVTYGEKQVLRNIGLEVKAGSKTAIIGPTAAGKTQLLYLLTGLIKPDTGEVLYDGKSIHDYRSDIFYRQIGFVFQDSIVFNMSLHENIAFSEHISDEMLDKAIDTAELKSYVSSLPKGLGTFVTERGTNLSGGQKQRVMLARALALNPNILLLDDFTARVDRKTEQKIMANIQANFPNITLLTITQNIAAVENYEQIILMMEGEILASGTHDTLIRNCPEYVQIYNSQRSTSLYDLPT
ncbi:MAG: ABC transporter ATP-binding protein [Bacteroidales bacterium]|nr:ABC transporter ATP-binding protein [Bacteroidales bacterium]